MHSFDSFATNSRRRLRRPRRRRNRGTGADVRFVAGGKTLLDLMKLNVETPARVLESSFAARQDRINA